MNDEETHVAEAMAGPMGFPEFKKAVEKLGYSVGDGWEKIRDVRRPRWEFHRTVDAPFGDGRIKVTFALSWYDFGEFAAPRRYTLEAEALADSYGFGFRTKIFPFTPEGLVLRLDDVEVRLLRGLAGMGEANGNR